jgi:single-strand DNA-binding protein
VVVFERLEIPGYLRRIRRMSASPTTIVGNVTANPELKFLGNGTPKAEFSVAVSHYWTDASGEKQEKTSFFDVVAWRYLADDVARVLEKGVRVVVTGRLEQRSWEDEKTGSKRSKVELIAGGRKVIRGWSR